MNTKKGKSEPLLSEFDKEAGLYRDFARASEALLEQIMRTSGIQIHSITSRCKDRDSLEIKLARPEKEYTQLAHITDLSGVRITTYFAEDVDTVADIVEKEFVIDRGNSVDKGNLLDPDRFGYKSLHYVASFNGVRAALPEYARFAGRKVEIQVRSILQHAWAEIEHDLGYKSAVGVPRDIRRRFSRIAGLLELADDEFSAIRESLLLYGASVAQEITTQPETVGIDNLSLRALLQSPTSALRRLSEAVASAAGATLSAPANSDLERGVSLLRLLDVKTVSHVEDLAESRVDIARRFVSRWIVDRPKSAIMHTTVGVLYLCYLLLGESDDEAKAVELFQRAGLSGPEKLFNRLKNVYAETKSA